MDFDWDENNIDHISRHSVLPEEAEEALLDPRRMSIPARKNAIEPRRAVLGATENGRILFVVFVNRRDLVRVVTARDATFKEKQRYKRR